MELHTKGYFAERVLDGCADISRALGLGECPERYARIYEAVGMLACTARDMLGESLLEQYDGEGDEGEC